MKTKIKSCFYKVQEKKTANFEKMRNIFQKNEKFKRNEFPK